MARKKKLSQYDNIGVIYMVHNKTDIARVACSDQMGKKINYVIICCGWMNGIYSWDATKKSGYEIWYNGKLPCYCIPIKDLQLVKRFEDIKDDSPYFKLIDSMQMAWWQGEIRNGKAHKTDRYPEYFLYWRTH